MILDNTNKYLKYFKKIDTLFEIKSIGAAQERRFSVDHIFDGERHSFTELVYVDSGIAEVVENEKVYLISSGDIVFHAPEEFHRIKSAEGTAPNIINISAFLYGKVPDNLYKGVFHLTTDERAEFLRIYKDIRKLLYGHNSDEYFGQAIICDLTSFIIKICSKNNMGTDSSSDVCALAYNRVVNTMNKELYSNLSLDEIAEKSFMSVSYIKTLFYRYANTSPKNYYGQLRAREASMLILQGIPASTVAEKMNFSSPNYFTLFFKKYIGMTPSQYKKNKIDS